MGMVDAGESVENFQLEEAGEDLCDRRQIAGFCLLLVLLMRLQALFRQLGNATVSTLTAIMIRVMTGWMAIAEATASRKQQI